jgi:hypothetical protein
LNAFRWTNESPDEIPVTYFQNIIGSKYLESAAAENQLRA